MVTAQPSVLVVIPNYNQRSLLEISLESLQHSRYPADRVTYMVVDDASSDDSVAWVQTHFKQVACTVLSHNRGFAGACNTGLQYALKNHFDYVVLLNNDTRVEPDWLHAMVDLAAGNDRVGVVGGKIKSWDGQRVEFAGNIFNITVAAGGYLDMPDDGRYDRIHPCAYACGASALYRTDCLRQIGLLDLGFYMYNEDVDLSLRAWVTGWSVMYQPHAVMYHMRGKSKANTTHQDYLGLRNSLTTMLKNYQRSSLRHYSRTLYQTFVQRSAPGWCKRAGWHNAVQLPSILIRRRNVQAQRKISDVDWFDQVPHQNGWFNPNLPPAV